ncbi:MAG: AMP-dependent synthetase [Proteobacteria bacterium]|nr:MAG: AMP-dependent synthetase [Pseudomonadota bacterium]
MTGRLFDPSSVSDFDALCRSFRWRIPERFNIAHAVIDRHRAIGNHVAVYCEDESGRKGSYTFEELRVLSNRFANVLTEAGVRRGDRVAVVLPQRIETAVVHLAAFKVGAVTVPLSVLFGPDALEYRLADSGSRLVICDGAHRETLEALRGDIDGLERVIDCDEQREDGFWGLLERAAGECECVDTLANDPALIIYTSGTTGPPKGALVAHRCLLGNLTGFELSQDFFPQHGDLFWTPADWAWTGGLIDALLPSLYYGKPVLGYEYGKFDPERACELIGRYRVRNAFIPPTALKMMRQVGDIRERYRVELRSVMSAGESMGAELYEWGREALGIEVNEMWGQSEFNYIVGNSSRILPVRPGSMGKAYPGHRVSPVDGHGRELADGEIGELAAHRDDPVMFLGYWNRDEATEEKFIGEWWGTGDMGYRDADGYLWFVGRKDDVISSAGYRIGPGEIEDCLIRHSAVSQAAVIGSPDDLRGEIVKAFIVLADGYEGNDALREEIRTSVRQRLAAYEYPREIEFLDELPLTTTGKVRRVELRERERRRKKL